MPAASASRGEREAQGTAVQADLALRRQGPGQGKAERGAARAHQPGQAHDLTLPNGERHVAEEARGGEPAHLQERRARRGRAGRELVGQIAADHGADERGPVEGRGLPLGHLAAVAQHGHAVGEGEHLLEAVGDVEDGEALLAQAAQHGEQPLRLVAGQGRGGLVQDQHPRALEQRARDLDHLLLGHAQTTRRRLRMNVAAQRVEDLLGAALHAGAVHAEAARFPTQPDVGRRRKLRDQGQLLVDHADPQAPGGERVAEGEVLVAQPNAARVGYERARERLDERALARAVFAQQGVDLACAKVEVHLVEGADAGPGFGETADRENGRRGSGLRPSWRA